METRLIGRRQSAVYKQTRIRLRAYTIARDRRESRNPLVTGLSVSLPAKLLPILDFEASSNRFRSNFRFDEFPHTRSSRAIVTKNRCGGKGGGKKALEVE